MEPTRVELILVAPRKVASYPPTLLSPFSNIGEQCRNLTKVELQLVDLLQIGSKIFPEKQD